MRTPDRLLRVRTGRYELERATADAARLANDRNQTDFRRGHARQQAALGVAIAALLDTWERIDERMYRDVDTPADELDDGADVPV